MDEKYHLEVLQDKEEWMLKSTLTVGELKRILRKYPDEWRIMITWESTVNEFKRENIYRAHTGTLYFDADGNFYKKDYAINPKENE